MVAMISGSACGARSVQPPSAHTYQLSGTIVTSDLKPAGGSIVIATDPESVDEVAFARADAAGYFVLNSPIPEVGLTAATPDEWMFTAKVDLRTSIPQIKLTHECSRFQGRIALDDPQPWPPIEILRIGGFDPRTQGLFGTAVDANFTFKACLPAGEYYFTLASTFVKRTLLTMIPPTSPLVVRSSSKHVATRLPSVPLDIPVQTRPAFLDDIPATARLVGFGESNHGSSEFNNERTELAIALARRHRFSLLLIEAGYGEVLILDDYIKGANLSLEKILHDVDYWMWRTTTFRESLIAFREYNRTASPDHKITLRGVDIQPTVGVINDLDSPDVQISEHDAGLLKRLREHQGARWAEFSPEERRSLRGGLQQISESRDRQGLNSVKNRHALSARSLLLALDLLEQQGFWDESRVRDKAMAQLSLEMLDLEPNARAIICAHLLHLAREYIPGAPTLGSYLAASLGRGYRVYALLARDGTVSARDAKEDVGVLPHPLPKAPPYTLESILLPEKSAAVDEITYWNFERAGAVVKHWMNGLHFLLLVGVYYPADNSPFRLFDLTSFDGAILFRHVTPIEPVDEVPSAKAGSSSN